MYGNKRGQGVRAAAVPSSIQGAAEVPLELQVAPAVTAHGHCHVFPTGQILSFPFLLPQTLSQTGQCLPFPSQPRPGSGPLLGDHGQVQLGLSPLSHPCCSWKAIPTPGELRVSSVYFVFIWTHSKPGNFTVELY